MSSPSKKQRRALFGDISFTNIPATENEKKEAVGYVVAVTQIKKSASRSNSQYFDIQIQINETTRKDIRVMVFTNTQFTPSFFTEKKTAAQPIKLKNLSEAESGTVFFNKASSVEDVQSHQCAFSASFEKTDGFTDVKELSKYAEGVFNVKGKITFIENQPRTPSKCKQSVRDVQLTDSSGDIVLSVWEDHFPQIKDGAFFKIKQVSIRQWNGVALSTTRFTTFAEIEPFHVETRESTVNFKTFCCPSVINGNVNIYPACTKCQKKIQLSSGSDTNKLIACQRCHTKMLLKKALIEINVTLQIETKEGEIENVTIFETELNDMFGKNAVTEAHQNDDKILEKLLLLENHDFVAEQNTNIIKKILPHNTECSNTESQTGSSDIETAV